MANQKHLTLEDRNKIEVGLNNRKSFKSIALDLDKDCTTISKEIRGHLTVVRKGAPYRPFNDCLRRFNCGHYGDICSECSRKSSKCGLCGSCTSHCKDYQKEVCSLLSKPPYVCNGCNQKSLCTLEKKIYSAAYAHKEYKEVLSESRSGINLTEQELRQLDSVISPLLKNGQSLHHILVHNQDRISCCEKTAYLYADNNLFSARNLDMPRKVRFRPRKKKSVSLKVDKACRNGRTFEDFQKFREENPSLPLVELDSVEGVIGGPVLLTVHFVRQSFQLAFLRQANDSQSVTEIFNTLYTQLGKEIYCRLFPVLLADNGSEFSNPAALEFDENGERRSHVFYCHPSAPGEKGSCEVNHEFIRRVIPKGIDLARYSKDQISLMMDHINSYSRQDLQDKTPYEMMQFFFGNDIPERLGAHLIPPNEIILTSSLFQNETSEKEK